MPCLACHWTSLSSFSTSRGTSASEPEVGQHDHDVPVAGHGAGRGRFSHSCDLLCGAGLKSAAVYRNTVNSSSRVRIRRPLRLQHDAYWDSRFLDSRARAGKLRNHRPTADVPGITDAPSIDPYAVLQALSVVQDPDLRKDIVSARIREAPRHRRRPRVVHDRADDAGLPGEGPDARAGARGGGRALRA